VSRIGDSASVQAVTRVNAVQALYGDYEVKHLFYAFHTSFIPVSLFDLESRFFAPTHTCWRPACAGAVKVGRRSGLAARSVGRDDDQRGACHRALINAPQPCIR
jgi:hypothetical protein